jgi:hypothetical protein
VSASEPGTAVVATPDPFGLELDGKLACGTDVQAAVKNAISTMALIVACLVMAIVL